jgi:hypothetical protein
VETAQVPPLTGEEKRLLERMFHVQRISDDEIVFANKTTPWMSTVYLGLIWLVGNGIALAGFLGADGCPSLACRWYWYPLLIAIGFPIVVWGSARMDKSRRAVVLVRGVAGVTVRLGDREWRILLPGGRVPTDLHSSSSSIPWRYLRLQSPKDQQAAATILARFTACGENQRPSESWLFDIIETGVDVVGFDDESISISGAGNSRTLRVGLGVGMTMGAVFPFLLFGFLFAATGVVLDLLEKDTSRLMSPFEPVYAWIPGWLMSMVGPFILARELSPYNVMTFWKGRGKVTLTAEGRGEPWTLRVPSSEIRQESLEAGPGNVNVGGAPWGCMPEYGRGALLVEYLQEILKPEQQRKPELTL